MDSDSKMSIAPRMITGRLSSKKLSSLKLPAAFPNENISTMSWNDQIAVKGNNRISKTENVSKSI